MSDLVAAPLLIPAVAAAIMVFACRESLKAQRIVSMIAVAAIAVCSWLGLADVAQNGPRAYALGDWPAPFGIYLVLDRLSGAMTAMTAVVGAATLAYAIRGRDADGRWFHPLLMFQLLGLNGAFLTGDVFNLFVFFEVMLIASYGLMLHGAGAERLSAGVQYVVINLTGSTLYLFAVGMIYATTGSLNMADLVAKAASVHPDDRGLALAGFTLLFVVFALKAAVFPLQFWLPRTYSATSGVAAAIFAVLTKVGAYALLRVGGLAYGDQAAAVVGVWLVPAGLATLVLGSLGMLAARDLRTLAAFSVVASTGTIAAVAGLFTASSTAAALYYIVHSTLAAAALFLFADLIAARRGTLGDRLEAGPGFSRSGPLAVLFTTVAAAIVGLPPLAGFVGKVALLQAAGEGTTATLIWIVLLASGLVSLVAFARAGTTLFWKRVDGAVPTPDPSVAGRTPLLAASALAAGAVILSAAAGPLLSWFDVAAAELYSPAPYVQAVFGPGAEACGDGPC